MFTKVFRGKTNMVSFFVSNNKACLLRSSWQQQEAKMTTQILQQLEQIAHHDIGKRGIQYIEDKGGFEKVKIIMTCKIF